MYVKKTVYGSTVFSNEVIIPYFFGKGRGFLVEIFALHKV